VLRECSGRVEGEAGEDGDGGAWLFHARETGYLTEDNGFAKSG
jgi:hypothetical protein